MGKLSSTSFHRKEIGFSSFCKKEDRDDWFVLAEGKEKGLFSSLFTGSADTVYWLIIPRGPYFTEFQPLKDEFLKMALEVWKPHVINAFNLGMNSEAWFKDCKEAGVDPRAVTHYGAFNTDVLKTETVESVKGLCMNLIFDETRTDHLL